MKKNNNKPLIIANWKMHKNTSSSNDLVSELLSYKMSYDNIVLCPPFTLLGLVKDKLKETNIMLGGQDCSSMNSEEGAFTGDVSAAMLKDIGCKYVIIGHSERRKYYLEENTIIKEKISHAHKEGLLVILCVGESLEAREKGNYKQLVGKELEACLPSSANPDNIVIAYEPIWAIGTGKTANIEQIEEMHKFLAEKIKDLFINSTQIFEQIPKIIYGGSVNGENAAGILSISHVSGLLVGGASLDAKKFYKIIQNI